MRLLVVSPDPERLEALRAAAAADKALTTVTVLQSALHGQGEAGVSPATEVLLVDATRDTMAELDALERLHRSHPQIQSILLAPDADPQVLLRALRIGVKEVLTPDTIEQELSVALERVGKATVKANDQKARTFVFVSTKGGSGSTFLAANFAYNLATETGLRVLLMDLDLRGGNASLMLTARKPLVTVADLAREIHRVDASFLRSAMIDVLDNLGIVSSPEDGVLGNEVRAAHVQTLVELARSNFDYLVVDIGRSVGSQTVKVLDVADHVFPVCQLSVPFIRETRRMLLALRSLDIPPARIRLLLNRHEKVRSLTVEDLEKAVGVSVSATIPNDYAAVSDSVNHGEALSKIARGSSVNKALNKLIHEVAGNGVAKGGWISRVFRR